MRKVMDGIAAEDLRLFEGIQKGVQSVAAPDIIMGFQERTPYWLEEEIDRRIGLDRVPTGMARSEEHTSELQSLMRISYAVFCLKKKKTMTTDEINQALLCYQALTYLARLKARVTILLPIYVEITT